MRRRKLGWAGLAVFGLFFCGIAVVIMCATATNTHNQAHKLVAGITVSAQVLSTDIQRKAVKKSSTYLPVVTFSYTIEGRELRASTVHPREVTFTDWNDARAVIDRYPVGSQITAYYDPRSLGEAYLEHLVDFTPYIGVVFPLLHFSVGLSLLLLNLRKTEDRLSIAHRMGVVLLVDVVIVVLAFAHYFSVGGAMTVPATIAATVCAIVLLVGGWWWASSYVKALYPPIAPSAADARRSVTRTP
ncbi:MAG TPA: DUF3592 domain-containing protein [Planctomycetota bacterium]|nr:DUF3592 domain-containing protein [Planctomycetota bacterium]